jgi:hypothetical protein
MSAKSSKLTSAQKEALSEVADGFANGTLSTRTLRSAVKKIEGKNDAKKALKQVRGGWGLFQKTEGAKLPANMPFVDRTRALAKKWAVADKDKWNARAAALNRRNASKAAEDDEEE